MAALWNVVSSPLRRLSVGIGLMSPTEEETKCEDKEPLKSSVVSIFPPQVSTENPSPKLVVPQAHPAAKKKKALSEVTNKGSLAVNFKAQKSKPVSSKAKIKVVAKPVNHQALLKVKQERLRTTLRKKHKAGFYSQANLEDRAWKGKGTEAEPISF
mmetsp:Transcript_28079/g.57613  ORF Transcript_28079/g.57613 Transcript_28079/m.57613 type:complete len:156 (-) Transcript_28079:282-749(-)